MLHDSDARHVHVGLEFGQRATFTLEEKIVQEAARRIGERLKNKVVFHIQPIYVTIWLPVKGGMNAHRRCLFVFAALNVSACCVYEREQIWFEHRGRFVELLCRSESLDLRKWCLMREQMDSFRRTGVDILQPSNGG